MQNDAPTVTPTQPLDGFETLTTGLLESGRKKLAELEAQHVVLEQQHVNLAHNRATNTTRIADVRATIARLEQTLAYYRRRREKTTTQKRRPLSRNGLPTLRNLAENVAEQNGGTVTAILFREALTAAGDPRSGATKSLQSALAQATAAGRFHRAHRGVYQLPNRPAGGA